MAIEKRAGAVQAKKKKKKKEEPQKTQDVKSPSLPKTVKPKQETKKQYNEFKNSTFQPKVNKAKSQTSLQKAQTAFNKGQDIRAKSKVVGTQKPETKTKFNNNLAKPKNYDYKSDLQKAAKTGSQTTYLGTKQEKTTTKLASPIQQVKQTAQQTADFYGSKDWKNVKSTIKTKNQEAWRKALSDQGWSRKEIDEWMNSDEGKAKRKETYMEAKNATKESINKQIQKGVTDANTLESVNALTKSQFERMQTASKYGKKKGNKLLKGSERMGTDDIRELVGSKTAQSAYESPFATGVMQGTSKADIFSGSVGTYNEGARNAIEQTKNKKSYFAGYGVGLAADMAMGGVASRGASLAEGVGKGVAKLVGKGAYKDVTKEVAEEAIEEYAKVSGKEGLKRFAKNRAGELGAETPINILDAAKMSMDTDGHLNKDEFKKWLIINSAFTFGVGGAMEGAGAIATKNLASNTIELLGKREAGNITEEELKQLDKNIKKLSKKSKADVNTLSKDIAEARMGSINKKNAQAAKTKAEEEAKQVPKGFHGGRKSRGQSGYTEQARQTAKQNRDAKWNAQVKKDIADTRARIPDRATTEAERKARKQVAQRHAEGAEASATRSRERELTRLQEQKLKLQKALAEADKAVVKDNTMQGHALAAAKQSELREAIKRTDEQIARAERGTIKGRVKENAKKLKNDNTLQGHEKAARERDSIIAELKARSDSVMSDITQAEKALEKKDLETIREVGKKEKRIREINDELKSLREWKKDVPGDESVQSGIAQRKKELTSERRKLQGQLKKIYNEPKAEAPKASAEDITKKFDDAHIDKSVREMSPKELADRIKYLEDNLPKAKADRDAALKEHRKGFTDKNYRSDHYNTAEAYQQYKENYLQMEAELEQLQRAKGILEESGTDFKALETPKAEPKAERPKEGFATFGKEEDQAELEKAGLDRTAPKNEQNLDLKPEEGQSYYEAHKANVEKNKQKEIENKNRVDKGKAEKEAKEHKSLWRTIMQKFVSDLEPFERMAMEGATKEERKRGRTTINGMLTARSKAMAKIRNEGMQIFEKRGLHKDAEKAKAYDTYTVLKHDLERLKQKSINVWKNGKQYNIDFGEGVVEVAYHDGNGTKFKPTKDLPIDAKTWRGLKDKSEEEIKAYVEKYVKDNDLEWNQLINHKSFSGYTEKTIKNILNDLEKTYGKDIKEFQQELVSYHHDLLKEDLAGGIISKDRYFKLFEKYKNYVPTFRDYDAISARSFNEDFRATNLYNIEARPFGSSGTADVIPQYTQMIAKTNAVMKRVAENEMLNAISKINGIPKEMLPHGHTPDELIEVSSGVYKTADGSHRIFFRDQGKGVSMPISDEAYHAIRRWSGAERAAIMELKLMNTKGAKLAAEGLTNASRAFKALITDYSIIFGCRNFIRDTATALVYSEHPAQWLTHFPKAAMAIVNKKSPYHAAMEQYIKDGGRYNALVTSTDLAKMPKLGKKEGIPGIRVIKDFNTAMETMPRMSEYIATVERLGKKNGLSFEQALKNREITQEAMYNAKEVTLNFDRKGQYGAMLNRGFVPFFNPSVQGIDKLRRFLYADNKSMAEFGAMMAKMGGMVVAPTLAWEYLVNQESNMFSDDPKWKGMGEAYRKLSAYNKYAYFCIPMGKDEHGDWEFLKIPRAREMASMQLPLDWAIQNIKYQNRDGTANLFESAKQAGKLAIDQIGPVNPLTDNYFSPIWRLKNNKTWMGGRIESWEDEEKRKQLRASDIYDSNTSSAAVAIMSLVNAKQNETLKKLGVSPEVANWIKKRQMSPKQLDNLFDSYLGVIHDMGIRPFSQQGASLESVKENPGEEAKQWLQSTFGTAFVVNGTLSSQRKSGMYANLYDMKDKVEEYPKGSKEWREANKKLMEYQNKCVYDVQSLDGAIDAINRSTKYTGRQKAELTKALKREQNTIIDDYNNGKNKQHDPLETMLNLKGENGKRVFSDDDVFTKLTYTDDDNNNAIRDGWNKLKTSDYYKEHPKKAVKDFKDITFETRKVAGATGDSKTYMDYQTMAIVCADKTAKSGKEYDDVMDAYNVGKSKRKMADVYINEMGGNTKTYTASHRHIVEGAAELGTYPKKLKDHDFAMILANAKTKNGNKLKDRAYWIEDSNKYGNGSYAYERMNYARCLSSKKYADSNWSYRKVHKFAEKYDLDWSSSDEDIVKAIEAKYPGKTDEEKAALFGVIKPTDENPFGEVGDYSEDGDSGYEPGGKGHGRRRGRRHRGGGGGGKKGTPYNPLINTAGSKAKVTNTSKKNYTTKSNLNDAYRKQLKKLREQSNKII